MTCEHCHQPIAPDQGTEPYSYPPDSRRVHTACVGELCREVLALMAAVPEHVRLCDPEGD